MAGDSSAGDTSAGDKTQGEKTLAENRARNVTEVVGAVDIRLDLSPRPIGIPAQLDAEQRAVVDHRGSPLLVLAGPGTGKTTTLIEAMASRLAGPEPLQASQVLGLTFGRQAASDWRDRLISRLGGGLVPAVSTFHSFAFSLVRQHADALGLFSAPRLLAGHEEDVEIREQLRSLLQDDPADWPAHVRAAAVTHEFARQVRAAVARARSFNLDAQQVREMAVKARKPEWFAVADVLRAYEFWLESADAFDYSGLISTATALARNPVVAPTIHGNIRAVFVDEFQDTDAAQVEFLQALVGPDCDLVVVGDPDQSIYAFRGAQVRGILDFAEHFGRQGRPSEVVTLRTCRRFGPRIRAAAQIEINNVDYAGSAVWAQARNQHRQPVCAPGARGKGTEDGQGEGSDSVDVFLAADARSEAAEIADRIRRLRHSGADWDDIVILTRTVEQIDPLRRALVAADIPVSVAGDETPIKRDQAVAPLLDALLLVESPASISSAVARELLVSPLCGIDPADLRLIVRDVRKQSGADAASRPSTSAVLRSLVSEATTLTSLNPSVAPDAIAALTRFHETVSRARALLAGGARVEEVLWQLWNGDGSRRTWSARLRNQSLLGGSGGRRADRDIDAVLTLFEMASRASHTRGKTCATFVHEVRSQQVPVSETTTAVIRPAVSVMTAHRAKGLEWDHVFIAGVQEGVWPNVISRTGIVTADEMQQPGLTTVPTAAELLAEERRLFYVCVTRARRSVVVSAVQGADNSSNDERPSRFLLSMLPASDGFDDQQAAALANAEPGDTPLIPVLRNRGAAVRSLTSLVADLRRTLVDPTASDALKNAAAARLARVSESVPVRHFQVHPADPQSWWGLRTPTESDVPVRPEGPLHVSPTAVESLATCSLRWFFERQMRASTPKGTAAAFGSVVHAVCEHIARSGDELSAAEVSGEIDRIWSQMAYQAGWLGAREREAMGQAVERFRLWHLEQKAKGAVVAGVEIDIRAEVTVVDDEGTSHSVVVAGRADRIDVTNVGGSTHAVVFDIKSFKESSAPSKEKVATNIQLALYALALENGGVSGIEPSGKVDAGLVMVRVPAGSKSDLPKVWTMQNVDKGEFDVQPTLAAAAQALRDERFSALPGKHCDHCQMKVCCPAQGPKDQLAATDDEEPADESD